MLSIKEGRVRALIWERATDDLSPLTEFAVRRVAGEPLLLWISARDIACFVWPKDEDEPSRIHADIREGEYASQIVMLCGSCFESV